MTNQCEVCGTYCTVPDRGDICERCEYADLVRATTARERARIDAVQPVVQWVPRNEDWRGVDYFVEPEDRSAM